MSPSVHDGTKRGVMAGRVRTKLLHPSSHVRTSRAALAASGWRRLSGAFRSMHTSPTYVRSPVCSSCRISSSVAAGCSVAKMHARVVKPDARSPTKLR